MTLKTYKNNLVQKNCTQFSCREVTINRSVRLCTPLYFLPTVYCMKPTFFILLHISQYLQERKLGTLSWCLAVILWQEVPEKNHSALMIKPIWKGENWLS